MIGVDTNILVRFFTKDDPEQFKKTYQLFSQNDANFLISYPTLVELVWVLQRRYGFNKKQLLFLLKELSATKNFRFPDQTVVENAINLYKKSSADFSDCLIGVFNNLYGCQTTYTFDKKASNLTNFTFLQ